VGYQVCAGELLAFRDLRGRHEFGYFIAPLGSFVTVIAAYYRDHAQQ
jgi:hypothetical protein